MFFSFFKMSYDPAEKEAEFAAGLKVISPESLQEGGMLMLGDFIPMTIDIEPDDRKATYSEKDIVTFPLVDRRLDYINLNNAILAFKVRLYNADEFVRDDFFQKVLTLGGLTFIHEIHLYQETTDFEIIPYYNVARAIQIASQVPKHYTNEDTLMYLQTTDVAYQERLLKHDAGGYSETHWVMVPLLTILDAAGWIPIYKLNAPIFLEITLEQFTASFQTQAYGGNALDNIGAPQTYVDTVYEWEISKMFLYAHGLVKLTKQGLSKESYTWWAQTIDVRRFQTTGAEEESVTFKHRSASLRSATAVFMDPYTWTDNSCLSGDLMFWTRAGVLGRIRGTVGATVEYKPWITWYEYKVDTKSYPFKNGAGTEFPTTEFDNELIFHSEHNKVYGLHDGGGYTHLPMLTRNNETNHGLMKNNIFSVRAGAPTWDPYCGNPLAAVPLYYQHALCLYQERIMRWSPAIVANDAVEDFEGSVPDHVCPGCQFMMDCSFLPLGNHYHMIQGVDVVESTIRLTWKRLEAIQAGVVFDWGIKNTGVENTKIFTLTERNPVVLIFLNYDMECKIEAGLLTVYKYFSFFIMGGKHSHKTKQHKGFFGTVWSGIKGAVKTTAKIVHKVAPIAAQVVGSINPMAGMAIKAADVASQVIAPEKPVSPAQAVSEYFPQAAAAAAEKKEWLQQAGQQLINKKAYISDMGQQAVQQVQSQVNYINQNMMNNAYRQVQQAEQSFQKAKPLLRQITDNRQNFIPMPSIYKPQKMLGYFRKF